MSNDYDCVITGVGVANPAGCDVDTFWASLLAGQQCFSTHPVFPHEQPEVVGTVQDAALAHGIGNRQLKRLDRFVLLATAAATQAISSAGLDLDAGNPQRIGITIGNNTGGWSYVEPQLYPLYGRGDMTAINPYVATAWFPTAPQGEISIALGLRGFSKTIAAENLSAGFALQQAVFAIADGKIDVAVVCGTEAPLTPLVYNSCVQYGLVSPTAMHRPFQPANDGSVLAEGAAALVVERSEHATGRGAIPLAVLRGLHLGDGIAAALRRCVQDAPCGIDYVILDGRATPDADAAENAGLAVLDRHDVVVSTPSSAYGNTLGAAMATNLVTACLAISHQAVPPTALPFGSDQFPSPAPVGRHLIEPEARLIHSVAVNGSDNHGQAMSVLLGRAVDAKRYARIFPTTQKVKILEKPTTHQTARLVVDVNEEIQSWVPRRDIDKDRHVIAYRQLENAPLMGYMGGQWRALILGDDTTQLARTHDFKPRAPVDGKILGKNAFEEADASLCAAVDRNSEADLDAVEIEAEKRVAGREHAA